jgi:hypothetical protein
VGFTWGNGLALGGFEGVDGGRIEA